MQEVKGKNLSVIFDGTSWLGEALAIVVQHITNDWKIKQSFIRLQMLEKSLCGEELARKLISVLSVTYSVPTNQLLASMRDCSTVKTDNAAVRTLNIVYPQLIDIGCLSHAIDHVGKHL